ncbi:MAG: MerR family transcriptional regulator, partial [Burkholderiaceae bacterium]|nr:MerR family transcriptional regulator [Burkholderiaceae bacterium]
MPIMNIPAELIELIGDAALTVQDLARVGRVTPQWVLAHVEAGALEPCEAPSANMAHPDQWQNWRFTSAALLRVRRIAGLERAFDADPQLAALAADLIEEVTRLRNRL